MIGGGGMLQGDSGGCELQETRKLTMEGFEKNFSRLSNNKMSSIERFWIILSNIASNGVDETSVMEGGTPWPLLGFQEVPPPPKNPFDSSVKSCVNGTTSTAP